CGDRALHCFPTRRSTDLRGAVRGAPALKYQLAWLPFYMEEEDRVLGEDAWSYGLEKNRKTVETLARYLVEHGLAEKVPPVEELRSEEHTSELQSRENLVC